MTWIGTQRRACSALFWCLYRDLYRLSACKHVESQRSERWRAVPSRHVRVRRRD